MSAIFNATGERLSRTTNLVAANVDTTILGWARITAAPVVGQYRTIFTHKNAGYTAWAGLFTRANGSNNFSFELDNGGGGVFEQSKTFTVNQWFNFAYVRTGNNHRFYLNGVLINTLVIDITAVTWLDFNLGDDTFSNSDVEIGYIREYNNRVMTLTEINAELSSTTIVSNTNIRASYPLQANANDDSGGGNNLTTTGAVTFATPMPLTNITFNTALDIGSVLPYDAVIDPRDSSGFAQELWFQYTAVTGDIALGAWFFGDLTNYKPFVKVWKSPIPLTMWYVDQFNSIDNNKRIQIPLVVGTTYFFQVKPDTASEASATLTVNILRAPDNPHQIGDIFIPGDAFVPVIAAVLDPVNDYIVRRFVYPLEFAEGGDVSPGNGRILIQKGTQNKVSLLNGADFSNITDISVVTSNLYPKIRTCLGTDVWFVAKNNNSATQLTVYKINNSGSIVTTWGPFAVGGSNRAIAASNDESILYVSEATISGSAVRRYDLVGSAFTTDLVSPVLGYAINDILVLDDDSIVVMYAKGGPPDLYVKRFDASGTLLNTYTFSDYTGAENRMAYSFESDSFWVWYQINNPTVGLSRFQKIKASDGTILKTLLKVRYDGDGMPIYAPPATATPLYQFGPVASCPFMVLQASSSTGAIIVRKVTIPSDTTLFDINTVNLSPSSYQLANGDERTHSGLTPASNYEVSESSNALYDTVISVSNGSPANAIAVAAGETVIVTITNTLKSAATGKITVGKVTNPFNPTQLFSFTTGGGLSPGSFALHSEESQDFNVVPGSGYSIAEILPPGFILHYMVSNDPVNNDVTNITVGNGEHVTVMVLDESFGGGLFFPEPTQPIGPPTFPPGTGRTSDRVPGSPSDADVMIPNVFVETAFIRDL